MKLSHLKMDNNVSIVQTNQAGNNSHHGTATMKVSFHKIKRKQLHIVMQ